MHLTCCLSLKEKRGCRMGEKKEETKWHQSFDWKLCHSGQEQLLRSWTVPLSVDQLNNSQSFFLPFSAIHITPTITALRSCIFCLCKPRRQCVYWPFCCFWNVSQKIVLSKVSSFFSSTGDQNGRKCTWFLKNFSYTSPQVAFPIKEGLGEQVNGKL